MAASLTELGVLRGRREKEAELGEGQEERERQVWVGPVPPFLSLKSSLQCPGRRTLLWQVPGRLGQADGDRAALSARMSGPVSHSSPSGWE